MSSGDMASELVEEFAALRRQEAWLVAKIAEADRAGEAAAYGTLSKMVADVSVSSFLWKSEQLFSLPLLFLVALTVTVCDFVRGRGGRRR